MADNLGKRSVRGWLLGKMLSRVCDKKFLVWVKPYTPHPTPYTLHPTFQIILKIVTVS